MTVIHFWQCFFYDEFSISFPSVFVLFGSQIFIAIFTSVVPGFQRESDAQFGKHRVHVTCCQIYYDFCWLIYHTSSHLEATWEHHCCHNAISFIVLFWWVSAKYQCNSTAGALKLCLFCTSWINTPVFNVKVHCYGKNDILMARCKTVVSPLLRL